MAGIVFLRCQGGTIMSSAADRLDMRKASGIWVCWRHYRLLCLATLSPRFQDPGGRISLYSLIKASNLFHPSPWSQFDSQILGFLSLAAVFVSRNSGYFSLFMLVFTWTSRLCHCGWTFHRIPKPVLTFYPRPSKSRIRNRLLHRNGHRMSP